MNKKMSSDIYRSVICPRCKEVFDWEYPNPPSRGWICQYCRRALNMHNPPPYFHPRWMNDMEERKLEEYKRCEPGEVYQFEPESLEEALENIFDGGIALNDKKREGEACAG